MSSRMKWLAAIVFVAIVAALPQIIQGSYLLHLLTLIMMNAVLAMTFIMMLRVGLLNLSVAAFWGIGAYSSAILSTKAGFSFWLALPAAIGIAVVLSLILGSLLLRSTSLGFIITSLIFAFIVPLVFGTYQFFGGYGGIMGIPAPSPIPVGFGAHIVFGSETSYFYLLLAFSLVVVIGFLALYRSWAGRAWRALGLSPNLAQSVAINPFRYRLLAFAICSGAAALMGVFFAHYSTVVIPETYGPFKTIYVHMFAILGGVVSPIVGPILGAAILTILPEALRPVGGFEPIVTGALIIAIVVLMPQGLLGMLRGHRAKEASELLLALGWRPRRRKQSEEPAAQADRGPQARTKLRGEQ
jgi:branched-chain amino acid transport system permease protein